MHVFTVYNFLGKNIQIPFYFLFSVVLCMFTLSYFVWILLAPYYIPTTFTVVNSTGTRVSERNRKAQMLWLIYVSQFKINCSREFNLCTIQFSHFLWSDGIFSAFILHNAFESLFFSIFLFVFFFVDFHRMWTILYIFGNDK